MFLTNSRRTKKKKKKKKLFFTIKVRCTLSPNILGHKVGKGLGRSLSLQVKTKSKLKFFVHSTNKNKNKKLPFLSAVQLELVYAKRVHTSETKESPGKNFPTE